ncbi:2-amino-4-hydroxy-6-hydroxymethyldihydropteridine diphosphokinase [Clostridium sp.]|uniref:2-amino-4-hydroxy-6- hydroxymethyldihydropteridine diphosphokinase n=1 Tax=Clostridium sp. TaxID=1506 RepID=UPI001DF2F541|nr:2-amino-4-hydroxy-6-hydroxymethyldihydropteridine diphosphokinase [Clostridium sp.]MBS5987168.1 2-amino-4-hydroxy-6-hydroxymethyldihydropteridine diphosphokinase [Clostridium sp.]
MDKIYLKNVEIFANHGVFKEEKTLGQKFILDLELTLSLEEAGRTGDLTKSVHYGELCHGIEKEFMKESYDLIETAAQKVAEFTLYNYPLVKDIKVTLKKPWAPIGRHLDYAAVQIERGWHEVYLSIGSNIGNKEENLNRAIELINSYKEIEVTKVSSFLVTEPWGYLDQEEFVNAALKLKTILSPQELMKILLDIEQEMKRERIIKWGPRIIDLDIIFYDDLVLEDELVTVPHPRMEEREFVLKPLSEICGNKVHPLLKKRVFRLLEDIEKENC